MSVEGPQLRRPRHLVVRLPNPLGDAILATPALRALRRRGLLLTHKVAVPLDDDGRIAPRSMTDHYMALVAPFGGRPDDRRTELATTPFDEERAERRLRDVAPGTRLLGINPGAAFADTKILPPARIAAAVARIRADEEVLPFVLCGPGEERLAAETVAAIGAPCLSVLPAPPDLGELKALVRRCALLLTTDTGPRHVAEALGVPTVVWMGPTDPRWSEGGPASVVRNETLACLGCHRKTCPIGIACMRDLDPEAIAGAALRALSGA